MKIVNTITIDNLTENDMYDVFHNAFELLGVNAGDQIPDLMVDLRQMVILVMFGEKQ